MNAGRLFTWYYQVGGRVFLIEVFLDGKCLVIDESERRRIYHGGIHPKMMLLADIKAEGESIERNRKMEFGIDFSIDEGLLSLFRRARLEYDISEDVPKDLEHEINQRLGPVFAQEAEPFLTVPL